MFPVPTVVNEVFLMHKGTWTEEEKAMVHAKLNQHGITDGVDFFDVSITELMCMIYVDGIRDGRGK